MKTKVKKALRQSDSEVETQLGLVWGSPGIAETELQDSDEDEDNIPFSQHKAKTNADKPQPMQIEREVKTFKTVMGRKTIYHSVN